MQLMQATDVMRQTEAIGSIGAAFYFDPATVAFGKEHGLDGFRFYLIGRGGVLGDVEPEVVSAAFGYFEPGLVAKLWNSSKEVVAPREAARLYISQAHEFGRRHFSSIADLDRFTAAATTVIDAVEGASLPLFAALRAEPVPTDTPGAAIHQAMVLRELRGSVHLLALVANGLATSVAHAIRRPDDVKMFGHADSPEVSDADRAAWDRAEAMTDALLVPAYDRLDDAAAQALIDGTAAMAAALPARS